MSGRCRHLLTAGLLVALCWACGVRQEVIARVGGRDIEGELFQRYLGAVSGETWQDVDERVVSRLLDRFLDQEVVAAAAKRQGKSSFPAEPGERSLAVQAEIPTVCGPMPPVPAAAVEDEVARLIEVSQPARVHLRQMLLENLEEAEAAKAELDAGADFVVLSREVSIAPNAIGGGELGYVSQGSLAPDLDAVIFSLAAGETSVPVVGPAGYHIFQVIEVTNAGPPRSEDVRAKVEVEMKQLYARDFLRQCVDRLADEVGVVMYEGHLWFPYQGRYTEENDVAQ